LIIFLSSTGVDTAFVRIFEPQGPGSELKEPAGLAFTKQDYLVIADTTGGRVLVMEQSGIIITYYDARDMSAEYGIMMPTNVSVCNDLIYFMDVSMTRAGKSGKIYAMKFADSLACRARVYLNPTSRRHRSNGADWRFYSCQPVFIAAGRIACEEQLFVSAATGRGVLEFKNTNQKWVQTYRGIESPRGIAVDAGGRVFVGCETTCTVVLLV
jgi:hypothetical protein